VPIEEDLKVLESKLNTLKLDYDRYFLGTRPREPVLLRREVQKTITQFTNTSIQNTAVRFKFSSLCSRYQSLKRRWDETQRQIEDGTYTRHRFKAALHEREQKAEQVESTPAAGGGGELYASYLEARKSCGQEVKSLSPDRLESMLAKHRGALTRKFGKGEFKFRVVVEEGRARLKASRVGNSGDDTSDVTG
jgi:hypothetical protein